MLIFLVVLGVFAWPFVENATTPQFLYFAHLAHEGAVPPVVDGFLLATFLSGCKDREMGDEGNYLADGHVVLAPSFLSRFWFYSHGHLHSGLAQATNFRLPCGRWRVFSCSAGNERGMSTDNGAGRKENEAIVHALRHDRSSEGTYIQYLFFTCGGSKASKTQFCFDSIELNGVVGETTVLQRAEGGDSLLLCYVAVPASALTGGPGDFTCRRIETTSS